MQNIVNEPVICSKRAFTCRELTVGFKPTSDGPSSPSGISSVIVQASDEEIISLSWLSATKAGQL